MSGHEVYTHGHAEEVLHSHRWRTVENSAAYLQPELIPGASVLDVGCGPGTITADIARRVAPGAVVGVDRSAEVVALAARDHAGANLTFRVGDLYRLDERNGSFDVVHAHQVLQHLADPVAALGEMRRVCRKGGTVAVRDADYAAMTWWPERPGLRRWHKVYQAVARANAGEPDAGRRLVSWVRAAGFDEVTASASTWCFATPADCQWWARTWARRTTGLPFADRAVALGICSSQELASCADDWLKWAGEPDAVFIVVHGEVLAKA